jgi:hypothetical protein
MDKAVKNLLDKALIVYRERYKNAVALRDGIYQDLLIRIGEENFLPFKQKYYNKQLASAVSSEKEIMHYSVHDGEMIPIKDAIFRSPGENSWRAHFYAPYKNLFRQKVDTFWFNMVVIWIFTGLLLVLLYYDVIRRVLNYLETLRLNRLNKLKLKRLIKIAEQSMNIRVKR